MKEALTQVDLPEVAEVDMSASPSTPPPEAAAAWYVLSELAEHSPGRRQSSIEADQRNRLRGIGMATFSSLLVVLIAAGLFSQKMVSGDSFFWFGLLTAAWNLGFFAIVKSGLNLRCSDPNLTLPAMVCSIFVMVFLMASLEDGHSVLSLCYILPFVFGIIRLRTQQMIAMAAFVLAADFAIMVVLRSDRVGFEFDLLRWVSLGLVLVWFAYMGGYIGNLRRRASLDRDQLARAFETIKHMATHDELTGVLNRRHLVEVLNAEKARTDRYGGQWSVCLVDIDHFKRVNDTYGHAAGDMVLRTFAQAAQRIKRPTDAFGRYGGEEFMLVLVQTGQPAALVAAERLRHLAEQITFPGLQPNLRITISIGVAEARIDEDWQVTVDRADQALYRAKQRGRNRTEGAFESGIETLVENDAVPVTPSVALQTSS